MTFTYWLKPAGVIIIIATPPLPPAHYPEISSGSVAPITRHKIQGRGIFDILKKMQGANR